MDILHPDFNCKFTVEGRKYNSLNAAYNAYRTGEFDLFSRFSAQSINRLDFMYDDLPNWERNRYKVLQTLVFAKYDQNPTLQDALKNRGDISDLVLNDVTDEYLKEMLPKVLSAYQKTLLMGLGNLCNPMMTITVGKERCNFYDGIEFIELPYELLSLVPIVFGYRIKGELVDTLKEEYRKEPIRREDVYDVLRVLREYPAEEEYEKLRYLGILIKALLNDTCHAEFAEEIYSLI